MKFYRNWLCLLLPHKLYSGGGGSSTKIVNQENPEERALAKVSQEKWQQYQNTYVPLENEWMKQVGAMDNQSNHNDATGLATSSLKQTNGPQTQSVGDSMGGGHVGKSNYINAASTEANASNAANQGVTNRMLQGEQSIVAMGQGQATDAIDGLGDVARQSVNGQVANSAHQFQQQQATNSIYGTAAGMAGAGLVNYVGRPTVAPKGASK